MNSRVCSDFLVRWSSAIKLILRIEIMEQKSKSLSVESQKQYEEKFVLAGLETGRTKAQLWTEEPEVIPDINWSNMMLSRIVCC